MGFPGGAVVKTPLPMQEMQETGRFPGAGNGDPLQYSCLENPMDRGARWVTSMGCIESDTTEHAHTHTRTHTHTHTHTRVNIKTLALKKNFFFTILRRPLVLFVEFELECNF